MTERQSPKGVDEILGWLVGTAVRYRKRPENAGSQALLFWRNGG